MNKRSREEEEKEAENKVLKLESDPAPAPGPAGWNEGEIGIQRAFMIFIKRNKPAKVEQCLKFTSTSLPQANVDINCNLHQDTR